MTAADLERYAREVADLRRTLAGAMGGEPDSAVVDDDAVWEAYSRLEKLVSVIKFRLDFETPGAFTKLPDAKDLLELLRRADELLAKSEAEISGSGLVEALVTLRRARDNLRSYLTEKRKAATKAGRRPEPAK